MQRVKILGNALPEAYAIPDTIRSSIERINKNAAKERSRLYNSAVRAIELSKVIDAEVHLFAHGIRICKVLPESYDPNKDFMLLLEQICDYTGKDIEYVKPSKTKNRITADFFGWYKNTTQWYSVEVIFSKDICTAVEVKREVTDIHYVCNS